MDSRRRAWTPPPRPDWVARINDEGRHLNISDIVPLDEASLIASAVRRTGLGDFGGEEWREPFQRLIQSLEEEAQLNLVGRILTRNDLLQFLQARLQVEDTYKRHPEIEDEEIREPLLIIGQGRSGTSFLLNLLAEDPDNRVLRTWEAMFPVPPPETATYDTDPRIDRADRIMTIPNRVTPEMTSVHEFTGQAPTETIHIIAMAFLGNWLPGLLGQTPTYQRWMASRMEAGVRYEKRVLKLLQWHCPRKRWVLKNPDSLTYLPEVLKVYPDLRLAWAHRDPLKALASVVGLQGTMNWVRSDQVFRPGGHEGFMDPTLMAESLAGPIDLIESGVIRKDRLGNVQYTDLVRDPLGAVETLYRTLGYEFTPAARQALGDYTARNPRENRPPHRYSTGDLAQIREERKAFKRYQDYFGVQSEI